MSEQINPFPLLKIYKEVDGKIAESNCDERQLNQLKQQGWSMSKPEITSGPPDMPMPAELSKLDTPKTANKK